jgi:hypothetical protein
VYVACTIQLSELAVKELISSCEKIAVCGSMSATSPNSETAEVVVPKALRPMKKVPAVVKLATGRPYILSEKTCPIGIVKGRLFTCRKPGAIKAQRV